MMEVSVERDAAIVAMLPLVAVRGWTVEALTEGAGRDADLLFPGGAAELVEAYFDLVDRRMAAEVAAFDFSGLGVARRVRVVIARRFALQAGEREAVRRALGVLGLPGRGMMGARCLARTVDAVWHAAGDGSADFSWYTKRGILAGVYLATVLFWLRDESEGSADTLGFLDRRLAGVGGIGRLRARVAGVLGRG